jgi:DNA polymerase-1
MKRFILIDGSAVAYRSYFAMIRNPLINSRRSYFAMIRNPLINSRGENTGAVFGFINSLNKIIGDFNPDYLAVAFDTPKPTFRHEKYPEYKSTRAKAPDELVEQFPWIDKAVKAHNIRVVSIEGFEADDLIGTLARRAQKKKDLEVLIFTGDKDFYQLVNDKVKPSGKGKIRSLPRPGDRCSCADG